MWGGGAAPASAVVYQSERRGEYVRHQPERSLLHAVVRGNLATLREQARDPGGPGLPRFVERELERYVSCGILAGGFVRLTCAACGGQVLVAFSCKGRGICPSCGNRGMNDTAARLVDRVLPEAPYRQWVLTVPFRLRIHLARDPALCTAVLDVFLKTVFAFLRRRARHEGLPRGHPGAITFIQRFGSALNLHVHFHCMLADGCFDSEGVFHPLSKLSDTEVEAVAHRVARRVDRLVDALGLEQRQEEPDALASLQTRSMQEAFNFWNEQDELELPTLPRNCARVDGYSVHANVRIAANDRQGRERLLRYGGRPSVALHRMSRLGDGRIAYELKRPLSNGARSIALTEEDLMRRLAALVPPPRANLIRYHGVFAPGSRLRGRIVPSQEGEREIACDVETGLPKHRRGGQRLKWAELLKRAYGVEGMRCRKCGGAMRGGKPVTDLDEVRAALVEMGLPLELPKLAPARARGQLDLWGEVERGEDVPREDPAFIDAVWSDDVMDERAGPGGPAPPLQWGFTE